MNDPEVFNSLALPTYTDSVDQDFLIEGLNAPGHPISYLDRFPEELYNKSPDSHFVRFIYSLLGPAGVGWLKRNYLEARLILMDHGFETFDIERFYGDPFRFGRILSEQFDEDPTGLLPRELWEKIRAKDESYRSRSLDFFNAARMGTTPEGMTLAAKSGLGHPVEVIENYKYLFDIHSDEPKGYQYYGSTNSISEFAILPRLDIPRSEVQVVTISGTPSGGTFSLVYRGKISNGIAYNATALDVESALEPLLGAGNVRVTGGPGDTGSPVFIPYEIAFEGKLSGQDIPQMSTINALTGGVDPQVIVTTEARGVEAVDEVVEIAPSLHHNLQSAIDLLRPVGTLPTINTGSGLRSRQLWQTAFATSEYSEVIRYVTGRSDIRWPDPPGNFHWIEGGKEKPAPRVHNDFAQHYNGFRTAASVTASTVHAGNFDGNHAQFFPFLRKETQLLTADRSLADYFEPLTVRTQSDRGALINGIYPTDYASLPGIPEIKYKDEQFWASVEATSGAETLEIDLGQAAPVNYLSFEITRKPLDIVIEFDELDMPPRRRWLGVTPISHIPFPAHVFYSSDATSPWTHVEFHFSNGQGHIPITRYVRLTFTRRVTDTPFIAHGLPIPYSVDIRNLRLARSVV